MIKIWIERLFCITLIILIIWLFHLSTACPWRSLDLNFWDFWPKDHLKNVMFSGPIAIYLNWKHELQTQSQRNPRNTPHFVVEHAVYWFHLVLENAELVLRKSTVNRHFQCCFLCDFRPKNKKPLHKARFMRFLSQRQLKTESLSSF